MEPVAVLIPCYNEAVTISKVVQDFRRTLPDAVIYVYDNNSTDGTGDLAREAGAVVRREYQQGKGNVIRRMFAEVDAECYLLVDGDDTYPAESAPEMVRLVREHRTDMVVGDRLSSTYFSENRRLFHSFGNRLVRWSINRLFRNDIKDIMSGYRAFSYRFVKTFPVLSKGFEIETEMSIHAADRNLAVAGVVIDYRDRPEGSESKLNTYSDGCRVLMTIFRLFRICHPARYFGIIALALALVSLALFLPVLFEYWRTGLVGRFPTMIFSGFVMLAGIVAFFSGQILQTINWKNRQDFELELRKAMEHQRKAENGQ